MSPDPTSTTALDAKAALVAALQGLGVFDGVQRTWGFPPREPDKVWAYVGKVSWSDTDWASQRAQNETYTIAVGISVQQSGGDSETTETAAIGYMRAIQGWCKANPKLGLTDVQVITTSFMPDELNSFPSAGTYEAQFTANLQVTARIP